jgi:sulfate adenylyltransferase subunit 2
MQSTVKTVERSRERAVRLRLSGNKLTDVADRTGLSPPTVAALTRAYEKGGWEAVHSRRRGRPEGGSKGSGHALENLRRQFLSEIVPRRNFGPLFNARGLAQWLTNKTNTPTDERTAKRRLADWGLMPPDTPNRAGHFYLNGAENKDQPLTILWLRGPKSEIYVMVCRLPLTDAAYLALIKSVHTHHPSGFSVAFKRNDFAGLRYTPQLAQYLAAHPQIKFNSTAEDDPAIPAHLAPSNTMQAQSAHTLTHLQRLEAESIAIMREVVAEAENPVMLYSIGKDSAVMLHLAMKAFYPAKIPFPLLHIDTTWKFQDMYRFRAQMQKQHDFKLLIHTNEEGLRQGINPFTHGSQIHTDIMKTVALKQALDIHGFDVAFGGARRDEEKSRAKERVFSFRSKDHRWDPKNQRPEVWSLYNAKKHKGESIRVFPISNWTELDIWQYIYLENIPIVPLYFSAPRPVVNRDGTLIMVDDDRMPLVKGEVPMIKSVRFRTLGCYPLTGAVESKAQSLEDIIQEMLLTKTSERQGRVIDHDSAASMEKKKQEGYF